MAAVLPTQGPLFHPIPVTSETLSFCESLASALEACEYAAVQAAAAEGVTSRASGVADARSQASATRRHL
jgi:hypothetical protein